MKDGLSDDYSTCITQDKNGFIWIGTSNGLNRYDGNRIKQFFYDPNNQHSLPDNHITGIVADQKNRVWVSTSNGICFYNQEKDEFVRIDKDSSGEKISPLGTINFFYKDAQNSIWAITTTAFYKISTNDKLNKVSRPVWKYGSITDSLNITNFYRDKKGNEWAYTSKHLFLFDTKLKQPKKAYSLPSILPTFIYQDSRFNYWLGTADKGIFRFNDSTGIFTPFLLPINEKTFIHAIEWIDKQGSWLIVPGFSLVLINTKNFAVKIIPPNIYNKAGYQGTYWANPFIDIENRLWMGYEKGVNILQMHLQNINVIPLTSPGDIPYQEPEYGIANVIYADTDGYWINKWWGKKGLYQYDKNWNLIKYFASTNTLSEKNTSKPPLVSSIWGNGSTMYMTMTDGLVTFDKKKKLFKLIYKLPTPKTYLRRIIPFSENVILVKTTDGLLFFNTAENKSIAHYTVEQIFGDKKYHMQTCIVKKDKKILCSTYEGLVVEFTQHKNDYKRYQLKLNEIDANPRIISLAEDTTGNIWVATDGGVIVFNPVSEKIIKTFSENKFIGNVHKIVIDSKQNIWCTTRSSIWCFIQQKQKWTRFSSLDGLPAGVYGDNDLLMLANGSVLTGIGEKAIEFTPQFLETENAVNAPVFITEASSNKRIISLVGKTEKEIKLQPDENFFSVDFAVLDYDRPSSTNYFYKLEPTMKDFLENPSSHLIFNDLQPSTYHLKVRGGNKMTGLSAKEDVLTIIIKPYWYQTNLFKTACILLAGLLVFYFVRRRIKTIRKEASLKQKITETEMQALRAQMNPHFIFNSLNSIENFMMQNEKRLASDYLNKFSRLIRSILDSSRNELVPVAKDLEALQLYLELEQLRFNNKFSYTIQIDPTLNDNDYRVPTLLIQPYVENAIVHGIAHSKQKDLEISIDVKAMGEKIRYIVEDNGVGREEAKRINEKNKPNHKSVGLEITANRIAHVNAQSSIENAVVFTDLYDPSGQANGTRVQITIKAN